MSVIEINWRPSIRQLRQFAVIALVGFGLLGLLFAWRMGALAGSGRWTVSGILWAVGVVTGLLGLAVPKAIWPVPILPNRN